MSKKYLKWSLLFLIFTPLFVWAQYCPPTTIVKTFRSCSDPQQTVCTISHSVEYVPSGSCPPPPSPPQPPSPPPQSPPIVKTPEEIEREQHVKFCKEYPVKIKSAVASCVANARGYHGYFVAVKCSGVTAQTWNVGFSMKDILEAGYSQTVEPGPTCREDATFALEATISKCEAGGSAYQVALVQHCSDVK